MSTNTDTDITERRYWAVMSDDPALADAREAMVRTHLCPTDEALRFPTLVGRWSCANFDRPVPLVDRRGLVPGDVVYSSHYGEQVVSEVQTTELANTTLGVGGRPALAPTVGLVFGNGRTERYEGSVPLLASADRTRYGNVAR